MKTHAAIALPAFLAPLLAVLLTACATSAPAGEGTGEVTGEDQLLRFAPEGICDSDSVQNRLGERATPELGGELLEASGAQALRWIPPRSAVTQDFRPGRLNISYDDTFTITRIRCG